MSITKEDVLATLNSDFQYAMSMLKDPWPSYEADSWPTQAEEAKQWAAASVDDKPLTPFITKLFNDRTTLGISETFTAFVDKILNRATTYNDASAYMIALRQAKEKEIMSAADPTTVTWSF